MTQAPTAAVHKHVVVDVPVQQAFEAFTVGFGRFKFPEWTKEHPKTAPAARAPAAHPVAAAQTRPCSRTHRFERSSSASNCASRRPMLRANV